MPAAVPVHVVVDETMTLPARVSPSQVGTWRDCPLRYFFASVLRWREPETVATTAGTLVHDTAEALYGLSPDDRTLDTAQELLSQAAVRLFSQDGYSGFATDNEVHRRATEAVANLFTIEDPRAVVVDPDDLEHEFRAEIGGVGFVGKLDRRTRANVARISDYKSGKRPKSPYLPGKLAQLYLYAAAAEANDDPAEEVELLFLGDGVRVRRPIYPAVIAQAQDLLGGMRQASARALEQSTFTATPGPLCKWCAFYRACPAKAASAPVPGSDDGNAKLEASGLHRRASVGPVAVAQPEPVTEDALLARDVDADADWTTD